VNYDEGVNDFMMSTSIPGPWPPWSTNDQLREKRPVCTEESDVKTTKRDVPDDVIVPGMSVQYWPSCVELVLEPSYNVTRSKLHVECASSDNSWNVTDTAYNNSKQLLIGCGSWDLTKTWVLVLVWVLRPQVLVLVLILFLDISTSQRHQSTLFILQCRLAVIGLYSWILMLDFVQKMSASCHYLFRICHDSSSTRYGLMDCCTQKW